MPPRATPSSTELVVEPTVAADQIDVVGAERSARLVVISESRAGSAKGRPSACGLIRTSIRKLILIFPPA